MSKYIYKVLWFDDEFEKFETDIDIAFQQDVELIGFDNATTGLSELTNNYKFYDAVILDGLFYKDANQKGDADNKGFGEVAKTINNLKSQGIIIPWFIYSGQKSFVKEKNDFVELFADLNFCKGRVFDKNEDQDFDELLEEIKLASNQIESTKLRQQYANVFEVCTNDYLGVRLSAKLLNVLESLETKNQIISVEDLFTPLRKILEAVFVKMSDFNLLPKQIIENRGWINGSSLFLANKHSDYNHKVEFIDPLIAHTIHKLLDVIQDASHSEGGLKLKVDDYIRESSSDYLYRSCVYQTLEIICWFQRLKDKYPDLEENKKLWDENGANKGDNEAVLDGIIEQDEKGNYYCGNSVFQYKKVHNKVEVGSKIKITKTIENTSSTISIYPNFIVGFELI